MHLTLTSPVQSSGRFFTRGNVRGYCFGFNGKEKVDEVYGDANAYDFGARLYDPRLGRWLAVDPEAHLYAGSSPYAFVRNNPILRVDPIGKWDVEVHVFKNREKYGYGIAIVRDNAGNEIFRMKIRVQGVAGSNRMTKNADTPLGVYDIPDKNMWISGGDRNAYGPYHRLVINGESGELKESGRSDIRIHGGRQEGVENPELKKTHGCMRCFDNDIKTMKQLTDQLQAGDPNEFGGKLTIIDDLIEYNGKYYAQPDYDKYIKESRAATTEYNQTKNQAWDEFLQTGNGEGYIKKTDEAAKTMVTKQGNAAKELASKAIE